MRVLHAPVNIGNQAWVLSRHERMLGVDSDVIVGTTSFGYQADSVIGSLGSGTDEVRRARLVAGLITPLEYDAMHYYFGQSLVFWDDYDPGHPLSFLDLEIARRMGRPIIFTLQGCDVRLAGESAARNRFTPCRDGACTLFDRCLASIDNRRRELISKVLPKADRRFFLNPELGHFVPDAEFLPYCSVEIDNFTAVPPHPSRPAKILHAPSDASIKGTAIILDALEKLKRDYAFEVVLVEGMSHRDALKIYEDADLVIDQVLAGWYGGFAVEAMAMGKPVLCYLREEDFGFVPPEMIDDCPIGNVRPNRLVEDIAAALDRRAEWSAWSGRSRAYVEKWHNPGIIAAAMIDIYTNPTTALDLVDRISRRAGPFPRDPLTVEMSSTT
jgi:hypothetical protein